jgi:hypothetical protein
MTHRFMEYTAAAHRVERGWTQYHFIDKGGDICPLQAVAESLCCDPYRLPMEFLLEMSEELLRYPYYRHLRRSGKGISRSIIAWNDVPWRRKSRVVKFLRDMARRHEAAFLREENAKLKADRLVFDQLDAELDARTHNLTAN